MFISILPHLLKPGYLFLVLLCCFLLVLLLSLSQLTHKLINLPFELICLCNLFVLNNDLHLVYNMAFLSGACLLRGATVVRH